MPWLKQPGVRLDPTARIDRFADCVIAANPDEQGMVLGKCAFGSAVMTRPFDKRLEFSHRAGVPIADKLVQLSRQGHWDASEVPWSTAGSEGPCDRWIGY